MLTCKAQYAYALRLHKTITGFIMNSPLLSGVIAAIDLDDKLFYTAIEGSNINADCLLPAEFLFALFSIAEQLP